MSANSYNEALRKYIDDHPFDGDDSGCETVPDQLYQAYAESTNPIRRRLVTVSRNRKSSSAIFR